ncbi:uncharacterized protein [Linepithema humile]|uniref:uncharacterized protein n=1 Tax=Linepithema humile TaxID=83485 RepID=UPI00351DC90C
MDFAGSRYYRINQIVFTCLGLWQCHKRTKYIQCILLSPFLFSGIIFQLSSLITNGYSVDYLFQFLSVTNLNMYCVHTYFHIFCNGDKIMEFIKQVRYDWNSMKEEEELEIMHKNGSIGRRFTLFWMILMYIMILLFTMTFFSSEILNIVMPLNESRQSRQLPSEMEYFIDQEKYRCFLIVYLFLISVVCTTTLASIETFYMIYIQHTCAMFQITSYRIERMVNKNQINLLVSSGQFNNFESIAEAVDSHRRAFKHIDIYLSIFGPIYCVAIPMGVTSLSVNLYRLSGFALARNLSNTTASILYIVGHFCYMFIGNHMGQKVINNSNNIFEKICSSRWYSIPLYMQKQLLLMMHRSMKTSTLLVGGIFVPSYKGFATVKLAIAHGAYPKFLFSYLQEIYVLLQLTNMSLSYFMVLYSTRKVTTEV